MSDFEILPSRSRGSASVFKRHPFDFPEAEKIPADERHEFFQDCFVEPKDFDKVENLTHSTVFLAPHGGGKTAARLKLEGRLKEQQRNALDGRLDDEQIPAPLVVTYNEFSHVIQHLPQAGLQFHEEGLLACVAEAVFDVVQTDPQLFFRLDEAARDWWWAFFARYLSGVSQLFRLGEHAQTLLPDWTARQAERGVPFAARTSLARKLRAVCGKIKDFGLQKMCVLVDEADGYLETRNKDKLSAVIEPLLNTQALLSTPDLIWKIYLPAELKSLVYEAGGYKSGRLDYVHIKWNENTLLKFLRRRLKWGSLSLQAEGQVQFTDSLTKISESGLDKLLGDVDKTLVNLALRHKYLGAPKALLELGRDLVENFYTQGKLITKDEWDAFVVLRHQKNLHPLKRQTKRYQQAICAVVTPAREVLGTAFLASLAGTKDERVFLVTCAHVIRSLRKKAKREPLEIKVIPSTPSQIKITAKLLEDTSPDLSSGIAREHWSAQEDIAVFEIKDSSADLTALRLEDIDDLEPYQGQDRAFWGFGYEKNRRLRGNWVENLSISDRVGQGFWELTPAEEQPLLPGMSGTPISGHSDASPSEGDNIIGMVQSSYGAQTAYVIPIGVVYNTILSLLNQQQEAK
ncbi:MAG: hypothetical protein ACE5GO_03935 [Anaerolineales bacterium]